MSDSQSSHPVVGITTDTRTIDDLERRLVSATYARAIVQAGGTPVFLETNPALIDRYVTLCDAFVLTGGDDPIMEPFGVATHPAAKRVHPDRQAFELALLDQIASRPTLGVCLGMQYMALHAGGTLDQHLPDTTPSAGDHWDADHAVVGDTLSGTVHSKHRQAITDPGSLTIAARSEDGLIEAVRDAARPFYLGVQWHPERTAHPALGQEIFMQLIQAAL